MKISIVLATHNGGKYIRQQIESLKAQTLTAHEIIISDDNSSDDTMGIVHGYAAQDPSIRLLQNSTAAGFAINFLSATAYATGDLIAFCDQDDSWEPDKLELCARVFRDDRVVLAVHQAALIDETGRRIGTFNQGILKEALTPPLQRRPWATFYGFSMVFRKSLLQVFDPMARGADYITGGEDLSHDRWVMFLAVLLGFTSELPLELVSYRQHSGNLFGVISASAVRKRMRREELHNRSQRHLNSAETFLGLIENCDRSAVEAQFPACSLEKGANYWRAVAMQQRWRMRYAACPTLRSRLRVILKALQVGIYKSQVTSGLEWRALLRDLSVLF